VRTKKFWERIGFSLLIIAVMAPSLVLASCTKTSSTTTTVQTTTTTVATTAANTPQYGGSLTVNTEWGSQAPSGFDDMTQTIWSASVWDNPFTEWLCKGDINTFGPRGTNAFSFQTYENVPEQYLTGELAKSWTISTSPLQITFTLRQGIMFTGNTKIGMAARELTSADVVYSIKRTMATNGPASYVSFIKDATAPDRYTVVYTLNSYTANWDFLVGGGMDMGAIQPQEMATANANGEDWHNAVGTGPFILTDYATGVGATYTKNPNYWGSATIGGQSYKLPFIQTLYYPIIADPSTELAAIETGKIDWDPYQNMTNASTLTSTAPNVIQDKYLYGKVDDFRMNRINSKIVNQKTVRQALMIGTDLQTISNLLYNGGPIVSWPLGPQVPGFTGLAQLPAADQKLYTYSPTVAKQMLASAGYPNGFTIQLDVDAAHQDLANAVANMWTQIGVTLTINVLDTTSMAAAHDNVTYQDMLYENYTVVNPLTVLDLVDGTRIGANYLTTEPFLAMYNAAAAETNPTTRTADEQQLAVAMLDDVGQLAFAQTYNINCYQSWVKNYYNELDSGYYDQMPMIKQIWISK
jgi:peptide/nickel transport system substrate-binding protein